jgi:cation diffusion facilitator family transporter
MPFDPLGSRSYFKGMSEAPTNQDQQASHGPGRTEPLAAAKTTRAITWASVLVALTLMVTKLLVVILTGSVSLLASFADSALDFFASVSAFFAVRYAAEPADDDHRFGHGKAESFASLFQALLVAVTAALVAREAVERLLHPSDISRPELALAVMAFSIVLTLGLVWAQGRAIKKSGSLAVTGDQAHYKADLLANVSVIVGIGIASYGGWPIADALIGLGIALWLVYTAWEVAKGALDQMMDRELPEAERKAIRDIAIGVEGVLSIHELRTRASGFYVHMQFHLDLDPQMTLAEAHKIVVEVERRLLASWPAADILIHPDPKGEAEPHGIRHFRRERDIL